jgi:hypothetical protein
MMEDFPVDPDIARFDGMGFLDLARLPIDEEAGRLQGRRRFQPCHSTKGEYGPMPHAHANSFFGKMKGVSNRHAAM